MGSVVNIQALRGYDNLNKIQNRAKKLKEQPPRFCAQEECKVKLSMYNSTDYCSAHQLGNIPLSTFI